MNVAQIIAAFRVEVFDLNEPYLYSDAECCQWLTEAQEEAAIRKHLIEESESVHLTRFEVREGVLSYPLDNRMLMIEAADLRHKDADVSTSWPLAIRTEREMNKIDRFWRVFRRGPTAVIQHDTKLMLNSLPDGNYTLDVRGYRLPLWPLGIVPVSEVLATGSVTLTGGASGSVDTVTVNGVDILGASVPYTTSLSNTASLVAAQINTYTRKFTATASAETVTISDIEGTGILHNGQTVAVTTTTLTATTTNLDGGVDAVSNIPEIAAVHHRHLIKWMMYKAYSRLDTETFDRNRSDIARAEFEQKFGFSVDANYFKNRTANTPHHNASFL